MQETITRGIDFNHSHSIFAHGAFQATILVLYRRSLAFACLVPGCVPLQLSSRGFANEQASTAQSRVKLRRFERAEPTTRGSRRNATVRSREVLQETMTQRGPLTVWGEAQMMAGFRYPGQPLVFKKKTLTMWVRVFVEIMWQRWEK